MTTLRFPSMRPGNREAYAWHSDYMTLWDSCRSRGLYTWLHAGRYDTLGDGLTAHSPDVSVHAADLADYCASLAQYLLGVEFHSLDAETADRIKGELVSAWPERPSDDSIGFALGVTYSSDKPRWYNLDSRKVSAATSRQHDKRWHDVTQWMDGSTESAFRILLPGHERSLLARYLVLDAIYDYRKRVDGQYEGSAFHAGPLGITDDLSLAYTIESAVRALESIVRAYRAERSARHSLECYERNTRNAETAASEEPAHAAHA